MADGLRERQKAMTRNAIIRAAADLAADAGLADVPMTAIAEAAGVSERTLYNYFPTKSDLLADLGEWIVQEMRAAGFPDRVERLAQLPQATRAGYRGFSAVGELTRVYARIRSEAEEEIRRSRDANTDLLRGLVDQDLAHLPEERRHALALLLRGLTGSSFWYRLTQELQLADDLAAETVAWAVEVIIERAAAER